MQHCRAPAFRTDHLQKLIGAVFKATSKETIPAGGVFFVWDGRMHTDPCSALAACLIGSGSAGPSVMPLSPQP